MGAELKKYQGEYSEGSVYNRFLEKTLRKRKGFIYSVIDPDVPRIGNEVFLPIPNGPDNLRFACESCRIEADILAVRFDPDFSPKIKYALFIYFGCSICGATGKRRIFLDIRENPSRCRQPLKENSLDFYTSERSKRVRRGGGL